MEGTYTTRLLPYPSDYSSDIRYPFGTSKQFKSSSRHCPKISLESICHPASTADRTRVQHRQLYLASSTTVQLWSHHIYESSTFSSSSWSHHIPHRFGAVPLAWATSSLRDALGSPAALVRRRGRWSSPRWWPSRSHDVDSLGLWIQNWPIFSFCSECGKLKPHFSTQWSNLVLGRLKNTQIQLLKWY